MMTKIETFVGRKYGGWATGTKSYPSAAIAEAEAKAHTAAERSCGATPMTRRTRPV